MRNRDPRAPHLYRVLLRLLPSEFRERWGADMETVFRHRLDEAGGVGGRTAVWARGLFDIALGATREWFSLIIELARREEGMTMGSIGQDLRYALRGLKRSPGIAVLAVITLALGIGANTATFSVVDGVMLEPLPYPEADRLVAVWPAANSNTALVRDFGEQIQAFDRIAGISDWTAVLRGAGDPLEIQNGRVTPDYLDILGVEPLMGRGFEERDAIPGNDAVVVLSHAIWAERYGSDPDIVGRTVQLSVDQQESHTVIGVMPEGFTGLPDVDTWSPLPLEPGTAASQDDTWYVNWRYARIAPGATVEQASGQVRAYAEQLRVDLPGFFDDEQVARAGVVPLKEDLLAESRDALWVLLGAVAMVLLIACANVANLLLVRGEARARDLAVRTALGAGRGRVVRLLFLESLILGVVGGALGIAAAIALTDVIVSLAPSDLPRIGEVGVDGTVLFFALAVTLTATMLSGLWPAIRSTREGATSQLGGAARSASARGRSRASTLLVAAEVALAVVVTLGSGLMLRSLNELMNVNPGFNGENVVAFRPNPLGIRSGPEETRQFFREIQAQVEATPGVESAGMIHLLTGTSGNWSFPVYPEGVEIREEDGAPTVNFRAVRPGYFETLQIPLLQGRLIEASDREGTEAVAVVNRAFAEQFWPGENPVGKTFSLFSAASDKSRVVGVIGDVRQHALDREPRPELYVPHDQWPWEITGWIVAKTTQPDAFITQIRSIVDRVEPDAPITGIDELDNVMGESAAQTRFITVLLSAFGLLGLALGAIGVYGVTAYTVARRAPEFGVRIALGATRGNVIGSALRIGLEPVVLGLVAGVAAGLAGSRLLSAYLYQIEPTDPVTVIGAVVALGTVALVALLVPARRAGRVDPMKVLSSE